MTLQKLVQILCISLRVLFYRPNYISEIEDIFVEFIGLYLIFPIFLRIFLNV